MDDLRIITDALANFSPTIIKNSGKCICGVLTGSSEGAAWLHSELSLITIVEGDGCAATFSGDACLCLFVIGGKDAKAYPCSSSVVFFPEEIDAGELNAAAIEAYNQLARVKSSIDMIFSAYMKRDGLDGILRVAEEGLNNPVAVFDLSAKIIGAGKRFHTKNIPDTVWNSIRTSGYFQCQTNDDVQRFLASTHELLSFLTTNSDPCFLTPKFFPDRTRRLVFKIVVHGDFFGHCSAMEFDSQFRPGDAEIMRALSLAIGLELERTSVRSLDASPDSIILKELYNGEFSCLQELKLRTVSRHWQLEGNFILFSTPLNSFVKDTNYVPAVMFSKAISHHFSGDSVDLKMYSDDSRIMFLLTVENLSDVQRIRSLLRFFLESEGLKGALSDVFTDIMSLRQVADANDRLLTTGIMVGCDSALFDNDALYFPRIASDLNRLTPGLDGYLNEIRKIRHLDELHGTDFFHTIYTYLDTGKSVTRTANRLFLHRNTIVRRIEKFEELAGKSLDEGEWPFRLYVAFKLEEYSEKLKLSSKNA